MKYARLFELVGDNWNSYLIMKRLENEEQTRHEQNAYEFRIKKKVNCFLGKALMQVQELKKSLVKCGHRAVEVLRIQTKPRAEK